MIKPRDIMDDKAVAGLVRISLDRFQRRMRNGFQAGEYDFRQAKPAVMGGRRIWLRADVERIITERVIVK